MKKLKTSIKAIGLLSLALLISGEPFLTAKAQAPASVVYDPTNGATLASMLTTLDDVKEAQEEWKASKDFLKKVVDQGIEVKRLISLSESLICGMDEFEIYINVVADLTLCNRKLSIDITLSKIDGISGKLKSIVGGAYVLSQIETVSSLKDLNDEMESAINELNSLNTRLKVDVMQTLEAVSGSGMGHEEVSWGTDANI